MHGPNAHVSNKCVYHTRLHIHTPNLHYIHTYLSVGLCLFSYRSTDLPIYRSYLVILLKAFYFVFFFFFLSHLVSCIFIFFWPVLLFCNGFWYCEDPIDSFSVEFDYIWLLTNDQNHRWTNHSLIKTSWEWW